MKADVRGFPISTTEWTLSSSFLQLVVRIINRLASDSRTRYLFVQISDANSKDLSEFTLSLGAIIAEMEQNRC